MLAAARTLTREADDNQRKEKKKKKKKVFGLDDEGSSSEEGDCPVGRGSRGVQLASRLMRSMDENAASFNQDMRLRMQEALGEAEDHSARATQYAGQPLLQNQKLMGYFVWSIAHINRDLRAGKAEAAELRTMRVLAAIEQNLLDQHWRTAWLLTGLPEPPWPA